MRIKRTAPHLLKMSALGDGVIRTRVAGDLRGGSVLVLDRVVGAREGHCLGRVDLDGIRGAVDRNLGDVVAHDVVVRAVDHDVRGAVGDVDVGVGHLNGVGLGVGLIRRIGLIGVVVAEWSVPSEEEEVGAEESPPDTLVVMEQPARARVATATAAAVGRRDFRDMVSPFR